MRLSYKGKKIASLLIVLLLFLTACSTGAKSTVKNADSNETYTIRFPHILAEDSPLHQAALELKEELETESDGRLKLEIYPNGQLYDSERETAEAIQMNHIEMTEVASPVMSNFIPEFSVLNLPFLFDTREDAYHALDGDMGNILNEKLSEEGFIGLGYGENGFRNFLNNKRPIEKPEDLSGLKLRVIENNLYEDIFLHFGANASPLGFGETYTALQQGVYDGLDIETTVAADSKLDEVVEYLTIINYTYGATVNIINKDFFESLPKDLQEVLVHATRKYSERERELTVQQEEENLEKLKESMKVNELSEDQRDQFREELEYIYDEYSDIIGKDLMELANNYR